MLQEPARVNPARHTCRRGQHGVAAEVLRYARLIRSAHFDTRTNVLVPYLRSAHQAVGRLPHRPDWEVYSSVVGDRQPPFPLTQCSALLNTVMEV